VVRINTNEDAQAHLFCLQNNFDLMGFMRICICWSDMSVTMRRDKSQPAIIEVSWAKIRKV